MPDEKVNIRYHKFAAAFMETGNRSKAAIAAGYSEKTAGSAGSRLLKNAEVQKILNKPIAKVLEKAEITIERVLEEIRRIAFLDLRKLFDENGHLLPLDKLDDDTAAALSGVDIDDLYEGYGEDRRHIGVTKKIRTNNKLDALSRLLTHLGADGGKDAKLFNLTINLGEPARPGDGAKIINQPGTLPTVRL